MIALSGSILNSRLDPEKFWSSQEGKISKRLTKMPRYFDRLFGLERSSLQRPQAKDQQAGALLLPMMRWVDRHFRWWGRSGTGPWPGTKGEFPEFVPRPLGLMAVIGMFFGMVFSKKRLLCITLLLPLFLYMFGTYAIGDAVRRYLQSVEWIGFVFVGVLLDLLICFLYKSYQALRVRFAMA
jgi:hypothetical protein